MAQTDRPTYEDSFRAELARLNDAQRAAVEEIEGPVMVLAGPGTGKTHLLSARIGNILLKTDARANNILCLTYTDAGVRAMRQRLLEMIGPEGHRVNIYTFHGFCSAVIQDNLEYFGRPRLEPLGDLERIRVIRQLLDELDVHHPLRRGRTDGYFYERHLYDLFTTMKSENWSVGHLRQSIENYLDKLPDNPDFQYKRNYKSHRKGDAHPARIANEEKRMATLAAAVELFAGYQAALNRIGRYDYADMIQWVLRAFEQYPLLLRGYQERYFYLLVDEFQDTNGSQHELVRLLADYWDDPNIFIVGDDDQAIYEFQGARLDTLLEFHQRYRDPALITLTDNYRSSTPILAAASALIDHNELRVGNRLAGVTIDKTLRAAGEAPLLEKPIRLLEYPDRHQENAAVLQWIRESHDEGVPYQEMAVVYARHAQAESLLQLLAAAGIPYRSRRPVNVLDETPVRQLRELLTYFQRELEVPFSGEYELYRLLHFPCFDLAPLDLARLSLSRKQGQFYHWRELLGEVSAYEEKPLRDPEALTSVGNWLESSLQDAVNLPLPRFVERILDGSGLLGYYTRQPDRARHLATFGSLLDFIRAEMIRRPRLGLSGLLDIFDKLDDNRLAIPLRHHLVNESAVTLVTAHSAKGLEFERVWILDASDKEWDGGQRGGNHNRFALPQTLTRQREANLLEARRRLFYVAITRAKSQLCISLARRDAREKAQNPSLFLSEVQAATGLPLEPATVPPKTLGELLPLRLGAVDAQQFAPHFEAEAIDDLLRDFRLSVSGFNRYLDCPLRFFYETLLGVPARQREPAAFGEALHEALQNYFLRMLADPARVFPGKAELQFYFEQALNRRRGRFTARQFKDRLTQGKRELATYYESHRRSWTVQSRVERRIRDAEVAGVPLQGTIDRIDLLGDNQVAIWDYKSGSHQPNLLRPPTDKNPLGGPYWRQLQFYRLLYENRPGAPRRVARAGVSYLVMNAEGEQPDVDVELSEAARQTLIEEIRSVWTNIQAKNFVGCGKADCPWCNFERETTRLVPIRSPKIEGLDDDS